MQHGRKRVSTALTGLLVALFVGTSLGALPTSPASAEPDIADVQKKVDALYREAEQASERVNDAKLELKALRKELVSLQADERRQGEQLEVVRGQVQDTIVSRYQGQGLSAVSQVIVSDDPDSFLEGLSTMDAYDDLENDLFDGYATESKALSLREDAVQQRTQQVGDLKDQLVDEKATIDDKLADAEDLLDKLKAEERAALFAGDLKLPSDVPASGRAAAAISYAMAQVGKAYVYGAAGPSAFDCSGLTMRAWEQAGVSLPHSSSAQYSSGTRISADELQPGDLVFYYSPISHVGMYIGNGLIVNALNPGAGVRVSGLYSMPYVGAVRPG